MRVGIGRKVTVRTLDRGQSLELESPVMVLDAVPDQRASNLGTGGEGHSRRGPRWRRFD